MNGIICRCEEVTYTEIAEARKNGASTSQELKMATRAGMGMCQGRVCRSLLERAVGELSQGEAALSHPSKLTVHYPVRPVPLGQLMKGE